MRYARQERFIGKEAQATLRKKHVVIVGVGALGSVAAELLCRAGVGNITLIDRDYVEEHNLQGQSLYRENDVGKAKAVTAQYHLQQINSDVKIVSHVTDLYSENADLLRGDVVVDGTDNMETRFLMNEYGHKNSIPWIYGSAIRDEGYMKLFLPRDVCFRCVFAPVSGLETCDTSGVVNSITHVIASLQVAEAVKLLLGKQVEQALLHITLGDVCLEKLSVQKKSSCVVCGGLYDCLAGKGEHKIIKFCGSSHYQIRGQPISLASLSKRLREAQYRGSCLRHGPLTIFPDGRVLIRAESEAEAKRLYARYLGA